MLKIFTPARLIILGIFLITSTCALTYLTFMQEKERDGHWPWPLNGSLNNQSAQAAKVWDDDHLYYTIAAQTRSGNNQDIDHVQETASGRWCKLGMSTVTLKADGYLENCPCFSLEAGRACIQF
ncbi:hypothetical protein [Iodobacter ciconiae]|uniref:Uncharacterized protein n=1 Tax=Iodobacter ciconiae TaxID=2496266 RepID=A0A3S8ZUA3_9NEIS|nr:hypothetical protein [Iodobacter ciconiae]AZN37083.1 hypothetical protein EJO50_11700 [Iodobacter ciconiae]